MRLQTAEISVVLPAPFGPEQAEELAGRDDEVERVEREQAVVVALGEARELEGGDGYRSDATSRYPWPAFTDWLRLTAGNVPPVTRIIIVESQPAVRAGLACCCAPSRASCRSAPPGRRRGGAAHAPPARHGRARDRTSPTATACSSAGASRRCRRPARRRSTPSPDPSIDVAPRVAGAEGVVDEAAKPADLFEAVRRVARGGTALPPLTAAQFDDAARAGPDDLALLAMLVDRTSQADVAETLRLDRRRLARRVERLLGRLRARPRRARRRPNPHRPAR